MPWTDALLGRQVGAHERGKARVLLGLESLVSNGSGTMAHTFTVEMPAEADSCLVVGQGGVVPNVARHALHLTIAAVLACDGCDHWRLDSTAIGTEVHLSLCLGSSGRHIETSPSVRFHFKQGG